MNGLSISEYDNETFVVNADGVGINSVYVHMLIRLYEFDEELFLEVMEQVKSYLNRLDIPPILA